MAKLKKPLFSLDAKGGLGRAISFVKRGGRSVAEKKPEVPDARTLAQLSWRHMYQKAVVLWHALSAAEKQEWESLARAKHMTGFAWFISQALKPNPGLYLPLQGGKMAGDIDLDKHRIQKLPAPVGEQEPVTRKYFEDNIPPGGYTQGCRVYHNAHQSIPTASYTYLSFNSESYDTDEMHDLVVNPERITIKTAGIYLVAFTGYFNTNAVGIRRVDLFRNASILHQYRKAADPTQRSYFNLTTIWQCTIGHYLRVRVYQTSGGPLDFRYTASYSPYFMAQRIG